MDAIAGIVAALAPDHSAHRGHELTAGAGGGDVEVKCSCGVRLTFLAAQIAALAPSKIERRHPKAVESGS